MIIKLRFFLGKIILWNSKTSEISLGQSHFAVIERCLRKNLIEQ